MIEVLENNAILIANWEKHQQLDKLQRAQKLNRERVAGHRERKKLELSTCNVTEPLRNVDVTPTDKSNIKKSNIKKSNIKEDSTVS